MAKALLSGGVPMTTLSKQSRIYSIGETGCCDASCTSMSLKYDVTPLRSMRNVKIVTLYFRFIILCFFLCFSVFLIHSIYIYIYVYIYIYIWRHNKLLFFRQHETKPRYSLMLVVMKVNRERTETKRLTNEGLKTLGPTY